MKQVAWIEVHRKPNGGVRYGDMAKEALAKEFFVDLVVPEPKIFSRVRMLRIPESLIRLLFLKGQRDVWVRDIWSVLSTGFDRTEGKNIAVIYHHDFSGFPLFVRPFCAFFHKPLFFWRLHKVDVIVVISAFWKEYFAKKGYKNIVVIHVGFDLKDYDVAEEKVRDFRGRYKLVDKPIVYLGNCQKAKGVVEAYKALQDLDVYLITSGTKRVDIPARHLDLPYREYLCLLKASVCALAMSKFNEGWCITAHEAMLLKTPVIGSGKGGMRELLEGGGQIICEDFLQLRGFVVSLLQDSAVRERLGEQGYRYAAQFSLDRFERTWIEIIRNVL